MNERQYIRNVKHIAHRLEVIPERLEFNSQATVRVLFLSPRLQLGLSFSLPQLHLDI